MAPLNEMAELAKRYYYSCPSGTYYSNGNCYTSNWYWYGRWIVLAVIIVFVVLFVALLSHSRYRRRRGMRPMYGMGWMAPGQKPGYNNPNAYAAPNAYQAPPQYSAPVQTEYPSQDYNRNNGYYGNQQEGIQLEQPAHSYQRGDDNAYEPPAGPPPPKV